MITVEYQKEKENRHVKYSLSLDGHAGYAPVGQDIVCSAVSILLFTLANALSDSAWNQVIATLAALHHMQTLKSTHCLDLQSLDWSF